MGNQAATNKAPGSHEHHAAKDGHKHTDRAIGSSLQAQPGDEKHHMIDGAKEKDDVKHTSGAEESPKEIPDEEHKGSVDDRARDIKDLQTEEGRAAESGATEEKMAEGDPKNISQVEETTKEITKELLEAKDVLEVHVEGGEQHPTVIETSTSTAETIAAEVTEQYSPKNIDTLKDLLFQSKNDESGKSPRLDNVKQEQAKQTGTEIAEKKHERHEEQPEDQKEKDTPSAGDETKKLALEKDSSSSQKEDKKLNKSKSLIGSFIRRIAPPK